MRWKRVVIVCCIVAVLALLWSPLVQVFVPRVINRAAEYGLETLVESSLPSVVLVKNNTMNWAGSGVALTKDIILTARHVVANSGDFTITLNDGTKVKATQAISSKKYDMGFIKLDDPNLTPAEFTSMKGCKLGTSVYVIGSPFGKIHFNSVTLGIISGLERDLDEFMSKEGYPNLGWRLTFQTDAAGHPGNSGCPVFTMDGKVRGILVAGFSPVLVHVVPVDTVIHDLEQIKILFTLDDYYIEEPPQNRMGYHEYWREPKSPRIPIWEPWRWRGE